MADIPRDPRQLARDILSGKVSLEDLAREQARRRGQPGGGSGGGGGQTPPPRTISSEIQPEARIPSPIQVQQPPRPAPPRPQQNRNRPAPPRPQQQQQRPKITYAQPPRPQQIAQPALVEPTAPKAPQTSAQALAKKTPKKSPLRALLGTKSSARRAIMLTEVLNKPLSLRD